MVNKNELLLRVFNSTCYYKWNNANYDYQQQLKYCNWSFKNELEKYDHKTGLVAKKLQGEVSGTAIPVNHKTYYLYRTWTQ
jgi:hypothetical protein